MWAFDTEDDSKGKVYWVNFFDGDRHVSFDNPHRAIEWLLEQRGEFWAVNLEYDLINVFSALLDSLCVLTYGGFGLLKASIYGRPVKFFNTLRHWPLSVEEMGERLGYPKLPFEPANLAYCQRDTEVTWKFVHAMLEKYAELGMDEVGATLPSTALKFYLKNFCRTEYRRDPDLSQWDFLGKSRYGGRCEVFHTSPVRGVISEYDIVSSYPAVMRVRAFPNLDTCRKGVRRPNFEREGVAHVTIKAKAIQYPLLPWRSLDTGKLLFPTGTFSGVWTYPELKAAIEYGYQILSVHEAIEYAWMPSPFSEYVDFLYDRRRRAKLEGDELLSYSLKIAMNSTFGKFSEEGDLQIISRGKRHHLVQVPKHSNMIWSCYILAHGRLALYRYMLAAASKGELLYVDTDSVFLRSPNKLPLGRGSEELGMLAHKGTYAYAHFKLPKLYRVDEKYKAKGVPSDRENKADRDKLKREFFYGEVAEFMKPYRWIESKKLKETPNVWREVSKQLTATYDKRQVLKGGHTLPLCIGGIDNGKKKCKTVG